MDKIKELYEKMNNEFNELKDIAVEAMYSDYFSKSKSRKEIIDNSLSKELGMRKIVGDNYFYEMLENKIMLLLDSYISNNNETNIKVETTSTKESPIILPNRPYKRLSATAEYQMLKDGLDTEYKTLNVFAYKSEEYDSEPKRNVSFFDIDDIEEPTLDDINHSFWCDEEYVVSDNAKEILIIISKLDKCEYLGFCSYDNGHINEYYSYNGYLVLDFEVTLVKDKLNVTSLTINGNLDKLDELKQ